MIALDAFFRFSGIGFMLLLIVIVLRDYRQWRSAPYLVLTCLSLCAAFIGYAPSELRAEGLFFVIVRLMDVPHLIFVWLFGLSLFDADFRLKPHHLIIGLVISALMVVTRLHDLNYSTPPLWLDPLLSCLSIGLIVHLCLVTLAGRRDDLLDKRRASRVYFILVLLFVTIIAAVSEPLLPLSFLAPETFKIVTIWPAIIVGVYWMSTFDKHAVTFSDAPISMLKINEKDKILHEQLKALISKNEVFKDSHLTIVSLAKQLGVSQHRLRALINQGLGHPNFSTYINAHRIGWIKRAFNDPRKSHIPILTLAMDAGFKSLSPFNTAFKREEGMTPSEYRQTLSVEQ